MRNILFSSNYIFGKLTCTNAPFINTKSNEIEDQNIFGLTLMQQSDTDEGGYRPPQEIFLDDTTFRKLIEAYSEILQDS